MHDSLTTLIRGRMLQSQQVDDEDENNGEPHEYEALDADSSAD